MPYPGNAVLAMMQHMADTAGGIAAPKDVFRGLTGAANMEGEFLFTSWQIARRSELRAWDGAFFAPSTWVLGLLIWRWIEGRWATVVLFGVLLAVMVAVQLYMARVRRNDYRRDLTLFLAAFKEVSEHSAQLGALDRDLSEARETPATRVH
jgi:hypothetical protein